MYEPKYFPNLKKSTVPFPPMRFEITHPVKYVECDDPSMDPLHMHRYLEIFFNAESDVSFLVNDTLYSVSCGDVIVSRANDIHVCIFNKSAVQDYFCLWIDADFTAPVFDFLYKENFSPLFSFNEKDRIKVHSLFNALYETYLENGQNLAATACLMQILVYLNDKNAFKKAETPLPVTFQRIIDDISKNFAEIHSVGDILKSHYVSSSTLTRWFRTYIHTSPREYLESQKFACAVSLLEKGLSVTEACMQSGFSDCSHFIVRFKKKFGETPFRYKRRLER